MNQAEQSRVSSDPIDREWQAVERQLANDPRSKYRRERLVSPDSAEPYVKGKLVDAKELVGRGSSEYEKFSGVGWKIHVTVTRSSYSQNGKYILGENEARLLNYMFSRGLYGKVEHGIFTYGHGGRTTGATIYVGGINEALAIARNIEQHLGDILSFTNEIIFRNSQKRLAIGSGGDRYLTKSGKVVGRMSVEELNIPSMEYDTTDVLWRDVAQIIEPLQHALYMGMPLLPDNWKKYQELIQNWNSKTMEEKQESLTTVRGQLIGILDQNRQQLAPVVNQAFIDQDLSQSGTGMNYVYIPNLE